MRTRELVAILALVAACTENPDPRRPSVKQTETSGFGGWIVATTGQGWSVQGELISVTTEYVHILRVGQPPPQLVYLRSADIREARLFTYESEGGLGVFGLLGTLSTISHGFILVLSAPVWIISTGIAAAAESSHIKLDYPDEPLAEFAKWARFPQGLPAGVDEEMLTVALRNRRPKVVPPAPVTTPPPPVQPPGETTPIQVNPAALFQQAKAAAAAKDCAKVLQISGEVQQADQTYWEIVFVKDPAIKVCLGL